MRKEGRKEGRKETVTSMKDFSCGNNLPAKSFKEVFAVFVLCQPLFCLEAFSTER